MSEYVKAGEMVEGAHCGIYTRKEEWKGLQEDPVTKKAMTKYELSRNCSVEIRKKQELTEDELSHRKKYPLYLEVGDKLKALCITVYIDQKRKLGAPVIDKSTGRHEGRLFETTKRTLGVIKYPLENIKSATQKLLKGRTELLIAKTNKL